ncbi:hypothetical protein HMPREF0027_0799 [Actinobacillus ureae ATCC 25976]|uniref:Uncharacterized protein n=1 Tax=Actinobacillus ureae ATCC 25976 TaxID=887324 RepID=E8KG32_9PAST|nr:hypothetical protein HMPREF0027_0799 [Actinobacillus ureae ATCC 25976]
MAVGIPSNKKINVKNNQLLLYIMGKKKNLKFLILIIKNFM